MMSVEMSVERSRTPRAFSFGRNDHGTLKVARIQSHAAGPDALPRCAAGDGGSGWRRSGPNQGEPSRTIAGLVG